MGTTPQLDPLISMNIHSGDDCYANTHTRQRRLGLGQRLPMSHMWMGIDSGCPVNLFFGMNGQSWTHVVPIPSTIALIAR